MCPCWNITAFAFDIILVTKKKHALIYGIIVQDLRSRTTDKHNVFTQIIIFYLFYTKTRKCHHKEKRTRRNF